MRSRRSRDGGWTVSGLKGCSGLKEEPPDLAVRGVAWNRGMDPAYSPSRDGMIAMGAGRRWKPEWVMASRVETNLSLGLWMHKTIRENHRDRTMG